MDTTIEASTKEEARARSVAGGRALLAGAVVVMLVTLAFFLLFWNRFLGLRSGDGGYTGAIFFLRGVLPYRDYFAPIPPLYLAHCAAVLRIFGEAPIVLRGFAVVERIALALLVFAWLSRFFRVKDATIAAMVTAVVSAGDAADPVSSYNHFSILLAVAAGYCASFVLDEGRSRRQFTWLAAGTGVLSFLALACKQTTGVGVAFAIPLLVSLVLVRFEGLARALRFLLGFAAGFVSSGAVFVLWLWRLGVLHPFLVQVFVTGPAAKASSPKDFWVHTYLVAQSFWWAVAIAVGVLVLCWGAIRRSGIERAAEDIRWWPALLDALLIGLGSIGTCALILSNPGLLVESVLWQPIKPTIYLSLLGSLVLIVYYFALYVLRRLARRQAQMAVLATISFVVAFMISLSYPAFEAMCVPGLGLFLALLLDGYAKWRRFAVMGLCIVLLFCETQVKMLVPFAFSYWWEDSVVKAYVTSALPELKGFSLPASTVEIIDPLVQTVKAYSKPEDTIFVYPELAWVYGLSERRPATFSFSHNIDVASDAFCHEEAKRLLRARPAVIIRSEVYTRELLADEGFWRRGKPSGQRELIDAAQELIGEYQQVAVISTYPVGRKVYVYVRPPNPDVKGE